MSTIIDSFVQNTREYNGKWYIAKPIPDTRWKNRLKDTIGVFIGKYTAVHFMEDIRREE